MNSFSCRLWLITVIFISMIASGSLVLNIVLLCYARSKNCEPCSFEDIKELPEKFSMKKRKNYRQKRLYRAPVIISDSDSSSFSDSDTEDVVWSRDVEPESRDFLSKASELPTSSESLNTRGFPVKSPTSPGLYMQSRKLQLPDITHTEQEAAPETVPLKDLSATNVAENILDDY